MKKWIVMLCCVVFLLSGCSGENPLYEPFESDVEKSLDASRPEGATALPDFSGEITDVRVTTIPRDIDIPAGKGTDWGMDLSKLEYRQIYYGYCVDGVWTDLPCENYELVSIFNPVDYETKELKVTRGYEAVVDDHMVKIGPYLLISIEARMGKHGLLITEDSIGSEIERMFDEYDRWSLPDGTPEYGQLIENRDSIISGWGLKWKAISNIGTRHYLLLKYDEIPEDYQLWTKIEETGQIRSLLKYADIQYLLEN